MKHLGSTISLNLWKMRLQWLKLKILCLLGIVLMAKWICTKLLNHSLYSQHLPRELIYSLPSPSSYLSKCEISLKEWVKLLNGVLETNRFIPKQDAGYLEHLSKRILNSKLQNLKQQ